MAAARGDPQPREVAEEGQGGGRGFRRRTPVRSLAGTEGRAEPFTVPAPAGRARPGDWASPAQRLAPQKVWGRGWGGGGGWEGEGAPSWEVPLCSLCFPGNGLAEGEVMRRGWGTGEVTRQEALSAGLDVLVEMSLGT